MSLNIIIVVGALLLSLVLAWANRRRRLDLRRLIPVALVLGLALRLLFALATPHGQAPDERAHLAYLDVMKATGTLPVVAGRTGSPDHDWEHYQPPVYYLALSPLHRLAGNLGSPEATLRVLRLSSPLIWLVGALLLLSCLRRLMRDHGLGEFPAAWTFWLVCLLPSFAFLGGALNNDHLLFTLGAGCLLMLLGKESPARDLLLGVLLGVALLTKLTALLYLAAVGLLLIWRLAFGLAPPGHTLARAFRVFTPALLLWAPWILRNLRLYDSVTAVELVNNPVGWPLAHGLKMTVSYMQYSFWAVAGEHNQIGYLVRLGLAIDLAAVVGLALLWRREGWPRGERGALLGAAASAVVVNLILVLAFGLSYSQGQGRFLYPLILPLGVLMGLGISGIGPLARLRDPVLIAFGFMTIWSLAFAANVLLRLNVAA